MAETWRDRCRPIIAEILERCQGMTLAEKRKALRDGWPGGERKNHPYKIWLDEIRVQLKLKVDWREKQIESAPGQQSLFQ